MKNPTDKDILDWLCLQHVEVRTPARYGSFANFHAIPDGGDEEPFSPSDLREEVIRRLKHK